MGTYRESTCLVFSLPQSQGDSSKNSVVSSNSTKDSSMSSSAPMVPQFFYFIFPLLLMLLFIASFPSFSSSLVLSPPQSFFVSYAPCGVKTSLLISPPPSHPSSSASLLFECDAGIRFGPLCPIETLCLGHSGVYTSSFSPRPLVATHHRLAASCSRHPHSSSGRFGFGYI